MYRHIVLFKIYNGVSDDQIKEALNLLNALGKLPGVINFYVTQSVDMRKGLVIIENALFEDDISFNKFIQTPEHKLVGEYMRNIADWTVGDYFEPHA